MAPAKKPLTLKRLLQEARGFADRESTHWEPTIYGVTDGKAVGTYVEQKFTEHLCTAYSFQRGNAANGIDFPSLDVDMKVTSASHPQSSCPFRSARQKVYGLGYGVLVFVYSKTDDARRRKAQLEMEHVIYVAPEQTADYQTTRRIRELLESDANADDLIAYFADRNLPVDEVAASQLADEILRTPPGQGYLTISNALQWRLQYARAISLAGQIDGIVEV